MAATVKEQLQSAEEVSGPVVCVGEDVEVPAEFGKVSRAVAGVVIVRPEVSERVDVRAEVVRLHPLGALMCQRRDTAGDLCRAGTVGDGTLVQSVLVLGRPRHPQHGQRGLRLGREHDRHWASRSPVPGRELAWRL